MSSNTNNQISASGQLYFADNLRYLLDNSKLNQKQFSSRMDVSESTLSGYLRKSKQPNISFLIKLKEQFPDISIDQILFDPLNNIDPEEVPDTIPSSDLEKYYGTYYLYYLDTNKKNITRQQDNPSYSSLDLRFGILFICKDNTDTTSSKAKCLALFGLKNRSIADEMKAAIDKLEKFDLVYRYLKEQKPHWLYYGKLSMSQAHFFISLDKYLDSKDSALIVLHHTASNKDNYCGGLGTINSASTGRGSDPIVQRIALSRDYAYISDEQIKSYLSFSRPIVSVEGDRDANQILQLAKLMYSQDPSSSDQSPYNLFTQKNIRILLNSCLESLITNHLENNLLWFGRVSINDDDNWYHLLTNSKTNHDKLVEGNNNDSVSAGTPIDCA